MRIQHNIAALNSYRNLTNNNSAVAKNLEKLSSGYRINRAGDDAAGLAISEKMRAQITGLKTAQKNANDGISLVQTAEGALTEVHSMLNRMVELANQSANGTYADEVDRENLQAEVDSLMDEINRISKSTNFNGLNLLDGSMSSKGTVTDSSFKVGGTTSPLPAVGDTLGTNTVLHKAGAAGVDKTTFSIDLHNLSFANNTGDELKLEIGGNTFVLEGGAAGTAGTALDAKGIADAFKNEKFKVTDNTGADVDKDAVSITDGTKTDNFKVTVDGTRITFTQDGTEKVNGDMTVKVSGTGATTGGTTGTNAVKAIYEIDLSGKVQADVDAKAIDGETIAWNTDLDTTMGAFVTAYNAAGKDFTATWDTAASKLKLEANTAGAVGGTTTGVPATAPTTDIVGVTVANPTAGADAVAGTPGTGGADPTSGEYNVSTTVIENKADSSNERLASTWFNLTNDMVADGGYVRIGDTTYTFTTDKAQEGKENMVYIGDQVNEDGTLKSTGLDMAAERLTKAAAANDTYTVGHQHGTAKITVTENPGYTTGSQTYDLTKKEGIEASLGFGTVAAAGANATDLILQIGDTSDDFNKMKVTIGSMSAEALGIGDIDISTQAGASAAVDKIKAAINKVSSQRGDLGAIQNRLEHTINNLSVTTENITAAESRIRDVDMAEEMMAYTKNNILVQAAQAMLAQANQVPQGVLQLLQ